MVNVPEAVETGTPESETPTVNVKVPAVVGMPARLPPCESTKPGGSEPDFRVNVSGATPPEDRDVPNC
jgi:hypothetical protein